MISGNQRAVPWASSVFGVDLFEKRCLVVQAKRRKGRLLFEAATPESLKACSPRSAIVCGMPPGRAMAVWLYSSLASTSKTRQVLPTLLDMSMPFPISECTYAFSKPIRIMQESREQPVLPWKTPSEQQASMATLALAARNADVENRLTALSREGIDPHVLDHEGIALWTLMLKEHPPSRHEDAVRLIVHLREREACVAIGMNRSFWSAHRIACLTDASLERTLRLQLDTIQGGRFSPSPRLWLWTGDTEPLHMQVRQRLEQLLPGQTIDVQQAPLFLARALAYRGISDGPLRFNLRRDRFAHPDAAQRLERRLNRTSGILIFLAALLLGLNVSIRTLQKASLQKLQRGFAQTIHQMAGWPVQAQGEDALRIAKRELSARQSEAEHLRFMFSPPLLDSLTVILRNAKQANVHLHSFRMENGALMIQGEAASQVKAEQFSTSLQHTLHDTLDLATSPLSDDRVQFNIKGTNVFAEL